MSQRWEYGSVRRAHTGSPLFMECDQKGQVLWMSEAARLALGAASNLVDAIPPGDALIQLGTVKLVSAVYFFRVLERGDRVLIGMQFLEASEVAHEEATTLLPVQSNFLRNFFRLQSVERGLSTRARQRLRSSGGRQSILQLERERQRLGRDLHTGVGQMLAAIRLQLDVIGANLPETPGIVNNALARIGTLAGDALAQVRSVSRMLHPPEWQRLTLEAALRQLWEVTGVADRFQGAIQTRPLPYEPELEIKVLMYRAAQEAFSNLARHSAATRIDLTLAPAGDQLVLTIQDNGVGFDVNRQLSAPAVVGSGIGLRSIREQAAGVGGTFVIESGPQGTRLEVSVPFPNPE